MIRRLLSILLIVLLPGLASCGNGHEAPGKTESAVFPVRAHVMAAVSEASRFETSGTVVSANRLEVASKAVGRITELAVTEGDRVERGQVLARIHAPELEAAAREARATETASRLARETADRQADRFRRLAASQVVTARDLELAELAAASARAEHERARARQEMTERNLDYAVLRAPRAGSVVKRFVRTGDLATPGRPLLVLEDTTELEIRTTLPLEAAWDVKTGTQAEISGTFLDEARTVTVDRVTPDSEGHTVEIYLQAGDLGIPSGTFVNVAFLGSKTEPALRVPDAALIRQGSLTGVFHIENARARLRWLRLDGDGRVLAGLAPGDSIVAAPPAHLKDGAAVEVRP